MPRAKGSQGSWFVTILDAEDYPELNNQRFPRIWNTWRDEDRFRDCGYKAGTRQWPRVVEALKSDGVAVLSEHRIDKNGNWRQHRYLSAVRVTDVDDSDGTLRLKIVEPICSLDR